MTMEEKNANRKKALFLYSSAAGKDKSEKKIEKVISFLRDRFEVDVIQTSSAEEGREAAIASCGVYDTLAIMGGDGTLKNTIEVISGRENAPALAYLGGGTLNDGGKNYGVKGLKSALKIIEGGNIESFDLGRANGEAFVYLAGIGAYMDVSYVAARKKKKFFGRFIYYMICIKEMFHSWRIPVKITSDKVEFEGKVCVLAGMNGLYIGGMRTNSKGDMKDGEIELLLLRPRLFNGFLHFFFHAGFIRLKGSRFLIETDPSADWCLDGEKGSSGSLEIKIEHAAYRAYCKK